MDRGSSHILQSKVHMAENEWIAAQATNTFLSHKRFNLECPTPAWVWTTSIPSLNLSTYSPLLDLQVGWVEFDITFVVKQWQAGKPNYA